MDEYQKWCGFEAGYRWVPGKPTPEECAELRAAFKETFYEAMGWFIGVDYPRAMVRVSPSPPSTDRG